MRLCLHIGKRLCNLKKVIMAEVYATASDGRTYRTRADYEAGRFQSMAQTLLRERESTEQLAVELFNHEEGYKHN